MSITKQGLAFLTVTGLVVNETFGPYVLMLALAGWLVLGLQHGSRVTDAIANGGLLVWVMPIIALLSVAWSQEASVSLRAAIETLMMITLVVMLAVTVPPRVFLLVFFIALVVVSVLSVPINNMSYDGMTGRTNHTGIFLNKNTFSDCSASLVMTSLVLLADRRLAVWMRAMMLPLLALGMLQNVQSRSVATTAAMALAIGWGAMLFTSKLIPERRRKLYVTAVVLGGIFTMAFGAFIVIMFQGELLSMVGKDPTLTGRTELWFYAKRFLEVSSSWGVGYSAFWIRGHPLAEYLWHLEHMESGAGFHFHNLYYEVAVELGIPGVLGGAALIGGTFLAVFQWIRSEQSCESIFFFSFVVFVLVIQVQGYNLFATFDPWYFCFSAALLYGQNWQKWRRVTTPSLRRAIPFRRPVIDPSIA